MWSGLFGQSLQETRVLPSTKKPPSTEDTGMNTPDAPITDEVLAAVKAAADKRSQELQLDADAIAACAQYMRLMGTHGIAFALERAAANLRQLTERS